MDTGLRELMSCMTLINLTRVVILNTLCCHVYTKTQSKPVKRNIVTVIEVLPGMNLTRIPDWWLEHQDGIVSQEVADDESSIHIDWFVSLHLGQEPQHITLQSTSTEHQQICHK